MARGRIFCCAKNCYNYKPSPNAPSFFNFPKDLVSRVQWAENAGRRDLITKPYAAFIGRYILCADHFEPDYFVCPEKRSSFKRNVNPIPTIFENNITNVISLRNNKTVEELPAPAPSSSVSSLDCLENVVPEIDSSELSSIVTVQLASDNNLLCSLSNNVTIAATAPAGESVEMECLMLCRLCASLIEVSLLVPIFCEGADPSVSQMIERFFPGKVLLEDGLPQHVCGSCMERLQLCIDSLEMFSSADVRLREMLQLCSLDGDSLKSSEPSMDTTLLPSNNLASPGKPHSSSLVESPAILASVGLPPAEEKSAEASTESEVPDHIVTVLDLNDSDTDFDSCAELAESEKGSDDPKSACQVCLKSFGTRRELFSHYLSAHTLTLQSSALGEKSESYQCTFCEGIQVNKKDLEQHLSTHMPADFVCSECDMTFKEWESIKDHMRTCHVSEEFLKTKDTIFDKEDDAEEKTALKCLECGKEFKSRTCLKKHEGIHSSDRNVLCSLCGKVLANLNSLRVHMRTHTDDRPFTCHECGKSFKGSTELRSHSVTHTREKVFECPECGRKFHSKSLVRQHMLSHTRDKPHKCHLCPAAFNRLGNLNQHKKKHINSRTVCMDVTHECTICGKRFQSELTLKYHVAKHTGEKHPFDCGVCGKRFVAIDPYRVHMRIHTGERPYECSICKKTFRSSATLKQHAGLHRDDFPYACQFCQRSFKRLQSLIVHKKTHTGEKPYACPLCGRPFAQKGDMLKHTRTHRTHMEGESVVMEINSINDLTLSESDITNQLLMSMPIVKVEMTEMT